MKFTEYCRANNLNLLRDDLRFIRRCLSKLPRNHHKKIITKYADIWLSELKSSQNQNLGRFKANLFIRELSGFQN